VNQEERAGAVGVLREAVAAAALAEERRLLVAGEPGDGQRESEVGGVALPDDSGRRND
jgi:hypothetical protein